MKITIQNKSVYASDAGQGYRKFKRYNSFFCMVVVYLILSGLLTEQFFSNKKFNVLSIDLPGHGNSEGPLFR